MAEQNTIVSFYVWRIRGRAVPKAVLRVPLDRRQLRAGPFARLLGTSHGFRPRDAELSRWALLTCGESDPVVRRWDALATERWRVRLRPIASRGRWAGREPFHISPRNGDGPVAAITRARLNPLRAKRFRQAVPAVIQELGNRPGLRLAFGMGEWPVGLQGTFSLWDSTKALTEFAYSGPHREVIKRTPAERWYAEELFARFAVLDSVGTVDGTVPL
jgi:hypothetical protein